MSAGAMGDLRYLSPPFTKGDYPHGLGILEAPVETWETFVVPWEACGVPPLLRMDGLGDAWRRSRAVWRCLEVPCQVISKTQDRAESEDSGIEASTRNVAGRVRHTVIPKEL